MKERKAFNFYKSYDEAFEVLNETKQIKLFKAIRDVQFFRVHINSIQFKDTELKFAWLIVKHSIESQVMGFCRADKIKYDELFDTHKDTLWVSQEVTQEDTPQQGQVQEQVQVQQVDEYFEKVWKWYKENTSRPIGNKPEAKKRFNAQFKKLGIDNIRKALISYLRECKRTDTFTKHLSSLLNQDLSQYIDDNENEQPRKSNALTIDKIKIVS